MSTPSLLSKQFHSSNTQPQTIRGIKKRAKKICLPGQAHSEALDIVAREMGYRDYYQAQRELSAGQMLRPPQNKHSIFLTAYWRNTATTPRSAGCETLQVHLDSPLNDLVSRHQTKYARNLGGFRQESPDHLEMMSNQESQARAWEGLFRAALSLQFMEVLWLNDSRHPDRALSFAQQ